MKTKVLNKFLIVMFLCFAVCLALIPLTTTTVHAGSTHQHCICGTESCDKMGVEEGHTGVIFNNVLDTSVDGYEITSGNYYLKNDVKLYNNSIIVPAGETLNLCLNGHMLYKDFGKVIVNNGTLNICDCKPTENTHKFKPNENGLWLMDETNGTKAVTGGIIAVENPTYNTTVNGGVSNKQESSIFNMYGGTICGHFAQAGAGVDNGGTFNMLGGVICGNYVTPCEGGIFANGAGVNNSNIFNMKGGKITDNVSTKQGGGVYTQNTFNLTGGEISNNTAEFGGGILNNAGLNISGNFKIANNKDFSNKDNNLCLNSGTFLTVAGELNCSEKIGISTWKAPTVDKPVLFAKTLSASDYDKFVIDNNAYLMKKGDTNDKELYVYATSTEGGTTGTGSGTNENNDATQNDVTQTESKLCAICKSRSVLFLGLCWLAWLVILVIIVALVLVALYLLKNKKDKDDKNEQEPTEKAQDNQTK